MTSIRQTNFLGGEVSPLLWGRTDLPVFSKALRVLRNFFVSHEGNAVTRPGTEYLGQIKFGGTPPRLVPFVYSDSLSYVLEFGDQYVRVWKNGAYTGVEIAVLYRAADLAQLQWAQVGAVLTLTHQGYPPTELSVDSTGAWTLAFSSFGHQPTLFVDPTNPAASTAPPYLVNAAGALFVVDAAHPPREWVWQVTATILLKANGQTTETFPVTITRYYDGAAGASSALPAGQSVVLYADKPVTIRRGSGAGLIPQVYAGATVVAYNFYRGRGQLFGFVGSTTSLDFVDTGVEPDYLVQPPKDTNPAVSNGVQDPPAAVAFFQSRRVFAGFKTRPGFVVPSSIDDYVDFDSHLLPVPGEALSFELASMRRELIRSLVPRRRLVVFTSASVWTIGGSGGEALDFDNVEAHREDSVGANYLPPLEVDNSVLFARSKGRGVRALVPDGQDGYRGVDITVHARHLFNGGEAPVAQPTLTNAGLPRTIVDWCYAEDPWGLVWVVRGDGVLLSLTYGNGEYAWARHDTAGIVVACCTVPEGNEDVVYLAIQRDPNLNTGTINLERFRSRVQQGTGTDDCCVDASVLVAGIDPTVATPTALTGLGHLEGQQVYVCAVGNPPQGPFTVAGGQITVPFYQGVSNALIGGSIPALTCYVGLPFTPEFETLDVAGGESRVKQKTTVSVGLEVDNARGLFVGQDFKHLTEWQQRTVADGYNSPVDTATVVKMLVSGKWSFTGRAALRQTQPLPVTVVGIVREVDVGG